MNPASLFLAFGIRVVAGCDHEGACELESQDVVEIR